MRAALNDLAEQVIGKLKNKVVIHRYDAYSTNSIYLKFDYGVANSLRISDHPGKKHLRYRFNLITEQTGTPHYIVMNGEFPMHFYPPEEIDRLVNDILDAREKKAKYYTSYDAVMKKAAADSRNEQKGFWAGAKKI